MSRLGKIFYLLAGLCVLIFLTIRFLIGGFVPALWIPLVGCLVGIVAAIWMDRKLYIEFLSMKTTKHGMNMGVMILMVLAMLGAINFVSIRHYKTFDFSLAQVNTLSDQSIKLLNSLDSELKVTYFYKESEENQQNQGRRVFQNLIRKYQDQSSKVVLDFVEVNKRPDLAEEYGVNKGTGTMFLEYKGRRNRVDKFDEQEITGALVKVTREKDKTVYLVTGHGEGPLDDSKEALGLGAFKNLLEGNRYIIKPLQLFVAPSVPADADVVIVPGPKQAFTDVEVTALEVYLKKGGSVLLALDPNVPHGLDPLLAKVGLVLKNNFVLTVVKTPFGNAADPSSTPIMDFSPTHPVTKVFGKNEFVLFVLPQGIGKGTVPSGITYEEILKTGENSFGFANTKFDKEGEKGPFTVMGALKGKWPGVTEGPDFNLMVVGDGKFFGNQLYFRNLNRDLILNSVMVLAKEENSVTITPKEITSTEMTLTDNNFYIFIFAFVIPLPILMMLTSGVLWFRRRHA